jgi:DNA-binding response OmpR family regulator
MKLLLVEDSSRLQELLGESLRGAEYPVDIVGTAAECRAAVRTGGYALFIIDLGLPDEDGLSLIRDLRAAMHSAPILVITARAGINDRIAGLDGGADDYIVKPFHHAEFLARVRALLRRPKPMNAPEIRIGSLVLNEQTSEVRIDGRLVDLRPSERRLLSILIRRAEMVVPKSSIEDDLASLGREVSSNAIEAVVSRLRRALDEAGMPVVIETVRGVGYILKEARAP